MKFYHLVVVLAFAVTVAASGARAEAESTFVFDDARWLTLQELNKYRVSLYDDVTDGCWTEQPYLTGPS
ncbi:hypothetical protein [uncultured Shimia sp.]|uniref:hypothetical protein n=1 Tax=uncultured Shimia sp. TaxID=573152 RepID=UPI002622E9FC|nr:hypothetical protein [uncultured Shimia sp.]